jgi:membrane associated rhomboid family serine protease
VVASPTPQTPETGVPTCYRHPGREAHIRCQRCERIICPDCMRPASVGFQCPECVKEGARTTRSGRTAYGGLRPTNASLTSGVLIAINLGVWLALVLTGGFGSRLFDLLALRPNGFCDVGGGFSQEVPQSACNGTFVPGVVDGAYWQLVTSMFTHVSVFHIAFNMLALWVLGPQLELAVGRARFLALYFLSGLAGSALVYWAGPEYGGTHGASGAVFGLMAALLIVAVKIRGDVRGIMTWIAINFVITFIVAGISWQGHVGGFLGGLAIGAILVFAPRGPRRTAVQVFGLVAVGVLLVVAIAARSAVLG